MTNPALTFNVHYTVYDSVGRILRSVNCPPQMRRLQRRDNEFLIEGESDPHNHMVVDGSIVERPENMAEVIGTSIVNVPVPSTMYIGPDMYEISKPTVDLDLPLGRTYLVRLESFPYKDKILKVVK